MMKALILFAAHTALRPGELFALEWSDIDFDRRRVNVARRVYKGRLALPKNGKAREVVLTPQARDALLPLDRSTTHVFESKEASAFPSRVFRATGPRSRGTSGSARTRTA
jgi:integrase